MPPAQQQQGDNSMNLIGIILLVGFILFIVGYVFGVQITRAYFVLKALEIRVFLAIWPTGFFQEAHAGLLKAQEAINTVSGPAFTSLKHPNWALAKQVEIVLEQVGYVLRVPLVLLMLGCAWLVFGSNGVAQYKKIYSMKRLLNQEKNNWPQVFPVAGLDLVSEDIEKGPWAMSLNPMQFAKKHGLLKIEKKPLSEGQLRRESTLVASVHEGLANKVFVLQLGPLWQGVDRLNLRTKALFTVFIARAHGDIPGSTALLAQFARSAASGKIDFRGIEPFLEKYRHSKIVQRVVQNHAYVYTVMASILQLARSHGILVVADFIWLKPIDRPLWYMLSSVGRQTPFAEVAGPFAHWLAEKALGRRLTVPMVQEASKALDSGVRDIMYKPEEEAS